ncbi:MAG: heavy-metal-associated domain-containing protein [Gemmatimonadaceae bacterium]|jgi:copper chaperone CopZ|nr:heavy-metal-associated domain-containing protein [Gemmatimonadaceae bacterium]
MQHYDLTIAGMTCAHCVRSISSALARVPGLEIEHVAVGHARVRTSTPLADAEGTLRAAIEAAGYTLTAVDVDAVTT